MSLAERIVRETPIDQDSVIVVSKDKVVKAKKGEKRWVVPEKIENIDLAFWCFRRYATDVDINEVMSIDIIKRLIDELESQGIPRPSARKITYYYRPTKSIIAVRDWYTSFDVVPMPGEITAEAVLLYWRRYYSGKGHCYGSLRSEEGRNKVTLIANSYNLEALDSRVGTREYEMRVKIITKVDGLERFLEKALEKRRTRYLASAFALSMLQSKKAEIEVEEVGLEKARELAKGAVSVVGHESTARFLSQLLSMPISVNRVSIALNEGDEVLVFQLMTRLPEGKVLSEQELAQVPYKFYLVKVKKVVQ